MMTAGSAALYKHIWKRFKRKDVFRFRFNGETKNFKLYYDGQHFVGEKRFDTVYDLVADGLIHFYIELRAADYIKQLSNESTYEESPYMAYNQCRLRHDKTLRVRPVGTNRRQEISPTSDSGADGSSDHADGVVSCVVGLSLLTLFPSDGVPWMQKLWSPHL